MSTTHNAAVFDAAIDVWRARSQKAIYQRDFQAWLWDVVGERVYSRMGEISEVALLGNLSQTLIKSANGTGKDLALDTPILTTEGWSTMGEIRVGQFVYDEHGKPVEVTFKSDVMLNKCYRVTFDDGAAFIAGEDHEWNTLTLGRRSHLVGTSDWREHWRSTETFTTARLAETVDGPGRPKQHLIPLAGAIQYPERDLPIDPYTLGAWLGDGTTIRAEITCNYEVDGYVIDQIVEAGYPMWHDLRAAHSLAHPRPYRWQATADERIGGRRTSLLAAALKAAGVMGNKHIPDEFMRASVDQRIALLRGLMDTDGWADRRGSLAGWAQTDKRLADQFAELLTSLGVRYSRTVKTGSGSHSFAFRPWFDPFTPGRWKSEVFLASSPKQASRHTGRTIVSVEPTLSVPTACISVDSESHLYLAGRDLVPTHNTFGAARWVAWWVTAFDPRDSLVIVTGPRLQQVEFGVFANLKRLVGDHEARAITGRAKHPHDPAFAAWPGRINEQNEWIMPTRSGNEALALAAVPSQYEAATRLVGLRKPGGRNLIVADEAGGLSSQVWDAAMALQTAGGSRGIFIGNPTNRGDGFYQRYDDLAKYGDEYNRFTISAYDTPALTGETVYPDDPARDRELKESGLTSRAWVASMERMFVSVPPGSAARYTEEDPITGATLQRIDPFHADAKVDGTFRVRVLGEFAEEDDTAFFPQNAIDTAYATELIEKFPDAAVKLGCDISRFGSDDTVVYSNQGGAVRFVKSWSKTDAVTTADRIHELALELAAAEVRIDVTGVGGPVLDMIAAKGPRYLAIGVDGATKSPDPRRFLNMRAYNHSQVRDMMFSGELDLDPEDRELWKQIVALTYKFANRGSLQITAKDEMRAKMGGSPDRLDAMIYAAIDLSWLTHPTGPQRQVGDIEFLDPKELLGDWTLEPDYPL